MQRFLENPIHVFFVCLLISLVILIYDGSLYNYWALQRTQDEMRVRLAQLTEESKLLDFQIHQADSLTYIERQAADQFDYVREGDLIFVFSD